MEGSFPNKKEVIWTVSDVFWTMQLTRNIPKNDEQHFLEATSWKSVGKLHGQLHYTGQNYKGTRGMNN